MTRLRAIPGVRRPTPKRDTLTFIGFSALLLIVWEVTLTITRTPSIILPKPSEIWHALYLGLSADPTSRLSFIPHIYTTMTEVVLGFLVGSTSGLLLAILSAHVRLFEVLMRPLGVAFQSIPKIALAPLVLIWFGFGFYSKFVLVALATFFPLFVNGLTGFRAADAGLLRMMRSFGASNWQIFRKVRIQASLPFVFAGLEIAVVHAVTSAIAAEFLGGQTGLGVRIIGSEQTLDIPAIFAVLVLLALMGFFLNQVIVQTRKRIVTWTSEGMGHGDQ